MDRSATRLINILVGNRENDAVIEMHFPAAQMVFENECIFALGGADFDPALDGTPIDNWKPIHAERGAELKFRRKISGNRCYLAVAGGFSVEAWLGSSSTNLAAKAGGYLGRSLEIGDRIALNSTGRSDRAANVRISPSLLPRYSQFPTLRITVGAEYDMLDPKSRETLLGERFVVTGDSDRMGFRMDGSPLSITAPLELLSTAVNYGTIQLLPSGQIVVLMADHQTTGGYPRLAHVIETDLPVLAQLGSGDGIAFELVEQAEAEGLREAFEREVSRFRTACIYGL